MTVMLSADFQDHQHVGSLVCGWGEFTSFSGACFQDPRLSLVTMCVTHLSWHGVLIPVMLARCSSQPPSCCSCYACAAALCFLFPQAGPRWHEDAGEMLLDAREAKRDPGLLKLPLGWDSSFSVSVGLVCLAVPGVHCVCFTCLPFWPLAGGAAVGLYPLYSCGSWEKGRRKMVHCLPYCSEALIVHAD